MQSPLVSVSWLNDHLDDSNLVVLDASTASNVSGDISKFQDLNIKGARYFDLKNKFSDPFASYPNTLLSPESFEQEAQRLGVNKHSKIVVYDNLGIYNSPRVWWMFKAMGHDQVAVLDGGLPAWINAGLETQAQFETNFKPGDFTAEFDANELKTHKEVLENIDRRSFCVIDARSKGRFDGTAPEPRQGMESGHIPNSFNLPFEAVLDNGFMKSKEELVKIFDFLKLENQPLVFSCGSGLTACIILLAAEIALPNKKAVFDGSWTEWASTEGAPIEKNFL